MSLFNLSDIIGTLKDGVSKALKVKGEVELTGSNVPDAQAIPAKIVSTYDQPRIVKLSTDTIVAAGASYNWNIVGTDYSQLRKFPFFAVVLSWKLGSSNLNWDFHVWQYMTNNEVTSTTIPNSIAVIDPLPSGSTSRTHAGRFRNLSNNNILVQVSNKSSQDQILSNLYVVGLDAI